MKDDIKKDFEKYYKSMYPLNHSYGLGVLNSYISPTIIEERQMNVAQMDCFSRLMMDRIIFFGTEVTSDSSNIVVSQLLYLASCGDGDISIYINSPGGSVYDGMSILDTMASISCDVKTNCTGLAASFGAMILCCGTRGKRSALPHSRIMIHQPSGGCHGKASDIGIEYKEIMLLREELGKIISQRTKKDLDSVLLDMENDKWMSAEEAKDYGLIDSVVSIDWD